MTDRRFIEESFPVKEVGEIAAQEKNIRHGHISTMHIWWARRPLAASRSTAYAAIVPQPNDIEEWQKQRDFIVNLSKWENSNNQVLLDKARRDILQAHAKRLSTELGVIVSVEDIENGKYPRPRVLDPFAGGGSYPLEALRLGCEAYANDYNPIAVLIEKATMEYPQKFGRWFTNIPEWANTTQHLPEDSRYGDQNETNSQLNLFDHKNDSKQTDFNPLLNAIHYWGGWVLKEVREELAQFYPEDSNGRAPVGYIWARTIPCQNPACRQEIPLMRQFWLAKKDNKKVSLYPEIRKGQITFHIVGDNYEPWPENFDPNEGTVSRAVANCPICGSIVDADTTRHLFQEQKAGERMIAVILAPKNGNGKYYRIANEFDENVFLNAKLYLEKKRERLILEWGIDPIPDETLPLMSGVFNVPIYGMNTWGSIYNSRQLLAIISFIEKVRVVQEMISNEPNQDFVKAICTYLGFAVDEVARFTCVLNPWKVDAEAIVHAFGRQALPMLWDYNENNPIGDHGGTWEYRLSEISEVIANLTYINKPGSITGDSAISLNYPNCYFDAIFTDPPYYNSVPYADLSDFFYVWQKRVNGHIFPELFSTPLAPKDKEITEMAGWDPVRYLYKDK